MTTNNDLWTVVPDIVPDPTLPNGLNMGGLSLDGIPGSSLYVTINGVGWALGINIPPVQCAQPPFPPDVCMFESGLYGTADPVAANYCDLDAIFMPAPTSNTESSNT